MGAGCATPPFRSQRELGAAGKMEHHSEVLRILSEEGLRDQCFVIGGLNDG
jgi:hypothetical protein